MLILAISHLDLLGFNPDTTEKISKTFKVLLHNSWKEIMKILRGFIFWLALSSEKKFPKQDQKDTQIQNLPVSFLCVLRLLMLSWVTSFFKFSLIFLKSFGRYEEFLCQYYLFSLILIDFFDFLAFPCYKKLMTSAYNRWCQHFPLLAYFKQIV